MKYEDGDISKFITIPELDLTITFPETWRGSKHRVSSPAAKFPHSRNILLASVKGRNPFGVRDVRDGAASSLLQSEFAHKATPAELMPDFPNCPASVKVMIVFGVATSSPSEFRISRMIIVSRSCS